MYVHVPAAWLSMFGYALVALSSFGLLVFRHPLADVSAKAAAPIGATFTFLCLVTGSLWGKPMWGAFWVWDPRLTSVLILFFLYLGLIALRSSIEDEALAAKLTAVLSLVGIVILPIIKFSVDWNSLHQPASVMRLGAPTIHPSLLWPLLVMAVGHDGAVRSRCTSRPCATRSCAAASRPCARLEVQTRQRPGRPAGRVSDHGSWTACCLHLGRLCRRRRRARRARSAWLVLDGRRQQRLIDELEARGVRRRSRPAASARSTQADPCRKSAMRRPPPRQQRAHRALLVWPLAIFGVLARRLRLRAARR